MEHVKILGSKGKLSATIHHSKAQKMKLAILCPGYLDSKEYPHLVLLANDLVKFGFTVVRYNPTGTWDSEGEILDYSTSQYLTDVQSVLEYMQCRETSTDIFLFGHDLGGTVAYLFAAQNLHITTVCSVMPICFQFAGFEREVTWKKLGHEMQLRELPTDKDQNRRFVVPYSFVQDFKYLIDKLSK